MRLHDFILGHREQILIEWEAFARSCGPSGGVMDVAALRDHANEMLTVIAEDLKTPQNRQEQSAKSKGHAGEPDTEVATAAEEHGSGRAGSGFTVEQMVAEFRALRASVIRLWTAEQGELRTPEIEDLTRFNEAIDQSLAESVGEFNRNVDQAKEMFLAMLGHDLRTPLGAIHTASTFMLDTDELTEPNRTLVARIATSATRTTKMVGDLLDFTRSRLGGGIPILREETHLGKIVHDVIDEILVTNPQRQVEIDVREELVGQWDAARISQALTNLIGNAVEHGSPASPVVVTLRGAGKGVAISIHNYGDPIPPDQLNGIFNPMKGKSEAQPAEGGPTGNLGLGLYIAERIVDAHRGHIDVESSEAGGTRFTVNLPRDG
jgi:signal transduction histidine kinase